MKLCQIISNELSELGHNIAILMSDLSHHTPYCQEPCVIQAEINRCLEPTQATVFLQLISPEGAKQNVSMVLQSTSKNSSRYQTMILPTASGTYCYGLEIVHYGKKLVSELYEIKVSEPRNGKWMSWSNGPLAKEVYPNLYVGNAMASAIAPKLGFQAVLNVAEGIDMVLPNDFPYKKIPIQDGAHISISEANIQEAVHWLESELSQNHKTIVNCRAGIGRSGSIAIAYVYVKNPQWSFGKVVQHVRQSKPDIYPHVGLRHTLAKLYPNLERPVLDVQKIKSLEKNTVRVLLKNKLTLSAQVSWKGEEKPYLWLRTNLNYDWEEILMNYQAQDIWSAQLETSRYGNYWATMSASYYEPAIDSERIWLGKNINIEVR